MAVSILYRFLKAMSTETFRLYDLYRGVTRKSKKKVALVSPAKRYVRSLEMCYNPIGKDDTRGSDVWGLYRDGLYRGKKSKKLRTQDRCELLKMGKREVKSTTFS